MKIYFVRHGEANYALEKKSGEFPGVPLTELGEKQAQELAKKLQEIKFDYVFCSDMRRTKETIQPSLHYLNKKPIYDSRIREVSLAVTADIEDNWYDEPKASQIERLESFFEFLKTLNGNILIVAHFGVINYLSNKIGKKIESPKYTDPYIIEF